MCSGALGWLGTPFHHQGRRKGAGVDCIGLVIGVARAYGFDRAAGFKEYLAYSKNPDGFKMSELLSKYLIKIKSSELKPADILHMAFTGVGQHVAILLGDNQIIHAHEPDGRVVMHSLDRFWRSRVMGTYRYRGLYG